MPLRRRSVCCTRGTRCQALRACAGPPRPPAPRTRGMASMPESSARGAGGRGQEGASEGASEKVVGFARRREWRQGPLGGDAAEPPGHRAVAAGERAGSEATDSPVGCQRSWEAHILPHDKWCQRWNSLVQAASTLGLERPSRTRPRTHPQALALVLPGPQPQHHSGWVFCELWVSQPLGSPSSHQHGWTHTHTRHHMYHHLAQEAASEQLRKPEGEVPSRRFVSCKQETDSLSLPLKDE